MTDNTKEVAERFEKFVEEKYEEKYGLSSTFRMVWGCEECGGGDAEKDVLDHILSERKMAQESIIKTLLEMSFDIGGNDVVHTEHIKNLASHLVLNIE